MHWEAARYRAAGEGSREEERGSREGGACLGWEEGTCRRDRAAEEYQEEGGGVRGEEECRAEETCWR